MIRRRRGFFYATTRPQLYLAVFLGIVSSAYIYLPIAQQLEIEKRNKTSNDPSKCPGTCEVVQEDVK